MTKTQSTRTPQGARWRGWAPMIGAVLVLGSATVAQGRVWPLAYAATAGEASMDTPFTIPGLDPSDGARCATLIDASTLPFGAGSIIDGLAFRRDALHGQGYAPASGRVEIRVGSIADALEPKAAFRDMWLGSPVRVATGPFSLPSAPPPGSGPAPFSLVLPFATPWLYQGGDLGFDIAFTGSAGTLWRRDAVYRRPSIDGQAWVIGNGCTASNGFVPQPWIDSGHCTPGGQLVARVQGFPLPVGLPGMITIGAPRSTGLDLGPIGMPSGCQSWVEPWSVAFGASGRPSNRFTEASFTIPIPAPASLVGARLAFEWTIPDAAIGSQLPLIMSDAMAVEIGATTPDGRLGRCFWAYGTTGVGNDYSGRIGEPDFVPVTEFRGSFQ